MVFKISLLQSKLSQCTFTDRAFCTTKIFYFSNLDPKDIFLPFTEMYKSTAPNSDTSHTRTVDKGPGNYCFGYTYTLTLGGKGSKTGS